MSGGVCKGKFTNVYELPLNYCDNCGLVYYRRQILTETETEKYFEELSHVAEDYLKRNEMSYSTINYLFNFKFDELDRCLDDTVFIVRSTDFLINKNFNKINYVFNDYISCFYFNINCIKMLLSKYKLNVVHINKYHEYIIFQVNSSENSDNGQLNELLCEELHKELYCEHVITNFYIRYIYFRNQAQNKMIENYRGLDYMDLKRKKNNYTTLFSIF